VNIYARGLTGTTETKVLHALIENRRTAYYTIGYNMRIFNVCSKTDK